MLSDRTEARRVRCTVNGQVRELSAPPLQPLVDVLRSDLGLTGTKKGCSVGVCGICAILVDGALVSACLYPVVLADGRAVTTIEGLDQLGPVAGRVRDAFVDEVGFQCGICTPGQVVAASALLAEDPNPDDGEIREWMTGNLCRCTGYAGILAAVRSARSAAS